MSTLELVMPRSKSPSDQEPIGPILAENLIRLGYAETVIKTTEIARLVSETTGQSMSRQRIANLLNAVRVNPETIELIAKGLNVDPKELMRRHKH
jgi:hypothetical protein